MASWRIEKHFLWYHTSPVDAKALAKGISSFKFVVSLIVWYDIVFENIMTIKQLLTKEFDIHDAINQLREAKKFLVDCRSDKGLETTLVNVHKLAEDLEILSHFEPEPVCIRRRKKQFTYEIDNEPIHSPNEKFKVNFYFAVLDQQYNQLKKDSHRCIK